MNFSTKFGIAALVGTIGIFVHGQQAYGQASSTAKAPKIDVVGICDITPERVRCWDIFGAPSNEAETIVQNELSKNPTKFVRFEKGKLNRYMIIRNDSQQGAVQLRLDQQVSLSSDLFGSYDTQQKEKVFRLSLDPGTTSLSLTGFWYRTVAGPVDIPNKLGTKAKVGEAEIEIGPWRKSSLRGMSSPGFGRNGYDLGSTSFFLGVELPSEKKLDVLVQPLDASGKPIYGLDRSGKPITPPAASKVATESIVLAPLVFSKSSSVAGGSTYSSNIEPKSVGFLRITLVRREKLVFADIPLNPRSGANHE